MNKENKKKIFEFIRFGIVGIVASGIHYGIYYYLQTRININIAYTSGYVVSMLCNFFLTTYLTFRTNLSARKAIGFCFSHLVNYLLHLLLLNMFVLAGVSQVLAPVFVLMIAVPVNFFLLRFVFISHKLAQFKRKG